MKDWTVREAGSGDWPAVASLLATAHLPLAGVEESLTGFLVSVRGETVIGCAAVERYGRAGLLRSVAVAEAERGTGLGQDLVHRSLERAASAGMETVTLLTTTAREFFPRFGFRVIPREAVPIAVQESIEFTEACPATATAMLLTMGA